ncbi:hypothetical protein N7532_003577 [Penicillium argentinense]|uniref:Nuclease PA3 n=1 Tax=Penicillium argentinense TaxID=1131581 RepID=A0A9W9KES6_9EURO|nr:uncharacterized protein N7532_003577 [Penicillium argentinense]KAJ5103048.1 hypothetical protein N7532_003577 [Penicillium argentinense]
MTSMLKVALVGLGVVNGAQAWGSLGHSTVAYVAQHYVSSSTASWAKSVLGNTNSSYLADIASWADQYRLTSAGKCCNVDYERDCGDSGCSISAIANYTQRVGDGSLSSENVAEALKFLVHFLGDITQPLHDEAYEVGGNNIDVTFNGYKDNLHSDWDTYIPEQLVGGDSLDDAQSWAKNLIKKIDSGEFSSHAASWVDGDDISDPIAAATRWASDGNALVCTVVMPDGAAALQKGDLYPTYYNSVIDTIELQIAKGGYRLANWLNMIYKSEIAKRDLGGLVKGRDAVAEPDLSGTSFLPRPRPLSRAKLARDAMHGDCCTSGRHAH